MQCYTIRSLQISFVTCYIFMLNVSQKISSDGFPKGGGRQHGVFSLSTLDALYWTQLWHQLGQTRGREGRRAAAGPGSQCHPCWSTSSMSVTVVVSVAPLFHLFTPLISVVKMLLWGTRGVNLLMLRTCSASKWGFRHQQAFKDHLYKILKFVSRVDQRLQSFNLSLTHFIIIKKCKIKTQTGMMVYIWRNTEKVCSPAPLCPLSRGSINNDWQLKWDFVTLRCHLGRRGPSIVDETKARGRVIKEWRGLTSRLLISPSQGHPAKTSTAPPRLSLSLSGHGWVRQNF